MCKVNLERDTAEAPHRVFLKRYAETLLKLHIEFFSSVMQRHC